MHSPTTPAAPYHQVLSTRKDNREKILDAFEQQECMTRLQVAEACDISAMTVQRATHLMVKEGILWEERRRISSDTYTCFCLSPAPIVPLLVINMTARPYTAHLLFSPCLRTPAGQESYVVRKHCPPPQCLRQKAWENFTVEENLRLLLSRVRRDLHLQAIGGHRTRPGHIPRRRRERAMAFRWQAQLLQRPPYLAPETLPIYPVLIRPDSFYDHVQPSLAYTPMPDGPSDVTRTNEASRRLFQVMEEELTLPAHIPLMDASVLSARDAITYAVTHSRYAHLHTSILCLSGGEPSEAFLLLRDKPTAPWITPTCFQQPLARLAAAFPKTPEAALEWSEFVAALSALLQYLQPDAVLLDVPALKEAVRQQVQDILPAHCALYTSLFDVSSSQKNASDHLLPARVGGAAMIARRCFWETAF